MSELDIQPDWCRKRQERLLAVMEHERLDLVILVRAEHVQWAVGPRYGWHFEPAVLLFADGHCTLVAPNEPPEVAAANDVITYEAQWLSTLRNDQRAASSAVLWEYLASRPQPHRVGVEFSSCGPHITNRLNAELIDVEPPLFRLRRRKDPDELARIKKAIDATGAMYAKAREIIAPGLTELEMFNELQAAAVNEFGEMLTGTGNDYACGVPGGPPRQREIKNKELYILDLGPAFRGYFADNCRTIAVTRRVSDEQQEAWEQIVPIFRLIERMVKPGASCRAVYNAVKSRLDEFMPGGFQHHLGHGIGLFPHEAPHLNSSWNDVFDKGDVFTVEPGLYSRQLRGGIRLENNYVVTAGGVELLTPFPLELVVK